MMNQKYIVLSINENPEYSFYLPLVVWAWKKFGWNAIVFYSGLGDRCSSLAIKNTDLSNVMFHNVQVEEYRSDTIAQVSRLYAACPYGHKDDYLMTSDVDMLPLSDYWQFDREKIGIWGHDLTGFQHMPICYIGMKRPRWIEVMGLTSHLYTKMIKRDLDSMPNAKSSNFEEWWSVDQQLITARINAVNFPKQNVSRGSGANGYPIGRVDRSAWSLNHEQFIDCHMLRSIWKNPDHLARTMLLLYKIWPNENFTWFRTYAENFASIA